MTFTRTSIALALGSLASLAAPHALAQETTGWYAGASAGRSATHIDDARITSGLAAQGLGGISISDDDRSTGYKVFGGYQFNPYLSVEAGFVNLGHFGYRATTAVPPGSLTGEMGVKGINLDLVGTFPLVGKLSALGRVGVTSLRTSDHFVATGAVTMPYASANPSQRNNGIKAGIGLAYAFTPSLSMRVEAERYRVKDAVGNRGNVDLLSLGLVYRFGAAPAPRPQAYVAPAPVYVAPPPPPPPPPVVVVAPPPPPPPVYVAPPAPAPMPPPVRQPKQGRN